MKTEVHAIEQRLQRRHLSLVQLAYRVTRNSGHLKVLVTMRVGRCLGGDVIRRSTHAAHLKHVRSAALQQFVQCLGEAMVHVTRGPAAAASILLAGMTLARTRNHLRVGHATRTVTIAICLAANSIEKHYQAVPPHLGWEG